MPKLEVFRSLRLREHNATPSHDDNFPLLKSRSCVAAVCIINGHWVIRYAVSSIFTQNRRHFILQPSETDVNGRFLPIKSREIEYWVFKSWLRIFGELSRFRQFGGWNIKILSVFNILIEKNYFKLNFKNLTVLLKYINKIRLKIQ
jgi:hypothetical protein